MKRFHHIDLIECIAILFVVIYHSRLYEYDFINGSGSIEILYRKQHTVGRRQSA